jgi:cytosine/adenosine deaminase-related metal-dependent hydrolase
MSVRESLRLATRGGAACLGRDDVGSISPGMRGDVALFAVDGLEFAGTEADPVSAVGLAAPARAKHVFVEGRQVVRDGHLTRADEDAIAAEGHRVGALIVARSGS